MGASPSQQLEHLHVYHREGGEWGGSLAALFEDDAFGVADHSHKTHDSNPLLAGGLGAPGSGGAAGGGGIGGAGAEDGGGFDDLGESGDLADATVVLAGQDPCVVVGQTHARLAHELSVQCDSEDPFGALLAHRVVMLRSIHSAISAASAKRAAGPVAREMRQTVDGRYQGPLPPSAALPPAVGLALHLLYSLLDFVRDDICEPQQRADFLKQVAPMLSELPPLCLSEGMAAAEDVTNHEIVLDSLRDFLYLASLPSACFLLEKASEVDVASALETPEMIEQRTEAATALLGLASARGRASDLLLAVKVLLGIGLPQPTTEVIVTPPAAEVVPFNSDPFANAKVPLVVESTLSRRRLPLTKSRLLKKSLPLPEAEGPTVGPESSDIMRTVELSKKAKKIGREDWASTAGVKLKPEIEVPPTIVNCMKPDEEWVPMDKESMAKFKEKRAAATTEKLEEVPAPVYQTESRLKPILSPLRVDSVLQQLHDAKPNGALRADMTGQFGDAPEVWTCGQNSYGELAHLDTSTRKTFSFVDCLKDKDVIHVAAGNEHTVVMTRSGDTYTAGYNDNGQCGHGSTQRIGQLLRVDKLHGKGAVQVHAYNGCEHTLVVLRDGRLVSFGYNYRGQLGHGNTASEAVPKLVRGLENRSVCNVSCSYYHTVISCEDGSVFSFGRNDFGQLGHGDTTDRKVPRLIESLRGQRTTGLACGQYHTCVSTLDGRVLSCGKNDYGQLGVDSSENHRIMVPVYGLVDNEIISEVRCGYYHTIALAKGGHVFGFGRNDYGQLGLGHVTPRVYGPNVVDQLEGKGIVRVAAGCYHSIVVGSNGMLYVFGRNNHGQLGTGDTNEQHSPWPVDRFLGKRVAMVAAGFYHSIVLTGGIERDESSAPPIVEASPFSAEFLLGLPNLHFSSDHSSFNLHAEKAALSGESASGEARPSAALEIGALSPQVESKELAFPEEDDMNGHISEHHGDGDAPDARGTSLAETLKMLATFDPSQSLIDTNGTVAPERAAIFILAHMDRLASACAPVGSVPFAAGQPLSPGANPGQSHVENLSDGVQRERHLYCVDICPETFETLLALLMFLHRDMQTLPHFDDGESASCYQQLYQPSMILACLRILTTNLAEFLRSPASTTVMGSMATHRSDEEQLNSIDLKEQRIFSTSTSENVGYEQQRQNVLFGLPCMQLNGRTKLPDTDTSELGRFRAVLGGLQRQLLALVLEPVSVDAAEIIQAEAAAILILGVELFYPSQTEKVNLLAELLTTTETTPQEDLFEEGFGLGSNTRTGRFAARHFILNPLLQRLAHDSLSSKLIPSSRANSDSLLQPSAGVLATLLRLLVKRMVTEGSASSEHGDSIEEPLLLHGPALTGRNQAVTAVTNSGDETYTLLTELLLTLQKHLMSWAGRQSSADECALDWEDDDGDLQPESGLMGAILDASISTAAILESSVPSGWNCLLEYSQMLLLHSIELLTNIVGTAGTCPPNSHATYLGHRSGPTNGGSVDFASLRRSLVGSILPSLVTALLPFSCEPIFAKRLMKLVTRFAQLLDALCFSTPDLRAIDTNYVRYRLGEGSQLSGVACKVGDITGPGSESAVDIPKLPWLLSLLKTTAFLAGRLASTMVIGNGNCHSVLASRCTLPVCEQWIRSPLFARGISTMNCNLLARHGVIPMCMDDTCELSSAAFSASTFYTDLLAGDKSVDVFCDWLRSSYAKLDQGYNIISRQAFRSSDGTQFRSFEKSILAALLQLNGLSSQASLYKHAMHTSAPIGQKLRVRSPPVRFLALWRVVSEASIWVWRRRGEALSGGVTTQCALKHGTSAASILVNFKPPDLVFCPLNYVPYRPLAKYEHPQRKQSNARRRWHRVQCFVRAAIRWRRVYAHSSLTSNTSPLVETLDNVTEVSRHALEFLQSMINASIANRLPCKSFLLMVLENHRRAATRQHGLIAFHVLLTSLKTHSLGVDVLQSLAPALRIHAPSTGHYLAGLHALGNNPAAAVRDAFTTLYAELLSKLNACTSEDESGHGASNLSSGAYQVIDSHQFLLLCDAWGLKYRESDWPFIARVGVLDTVRQVILRLEGQLAVSTSEPQATRSPAPAVPSGRNRRNVTLAMKHRERRLQHCITSAWSLYRLIACQLAELGLLHSSEERIGKASHLTDVGMSRGVAPSLMQPYASTAGSWFDLLSTCFDVFLSEMRHGLTQMSLPPESQCSSALGEKDKTDTQRPGHRRRCQEIITAPRRFVNMEDGMQIPAEQLLANSKGPDFSITYWLYLSQDSTGKRRTILTRGYKNERWPVILLRDDRRLEVAFGTPQSGITNMGDLTEKLTSKDVIPLNKWTHIGLVSEANKLRLYLNGALDSPRNNCGVPHRANRHPLYIGKVPEGCVHLDDVRGGFEGSMAHLRYYTRALSPIHVRIVCDQGPPETVKVKDRRVYQMCASLYLCAQSVHGKRHLSQRHWIDMLFQIIIHGTSRVQQAAIRILQVVLPFVSPRDLHVLQANQFNVSEAASPGQQTALTKRSSAPPPLFGADSSSQLDKGASTILLAEYLLRVIGLAVWRTALQTSNSLDMSSIPFLATETIPCNVKVCCMPGLRAGDNSVESDAAQQSTSITMEALSEVSALASEIIGLVRVMLRCSTWSEITTATIRRALEGLKRGLDGFKGAEESSTTDSLLCGLAALCVLGGNSDGLRTGAQVSMSHTDMAATVVLYDEPAGLAHVVMHDASNRENLVMLNAPSNDSAMEGSRGVPKSLRPVRISAEELFVHTSELALKSDLALLEASEHLIREAIFPLFGALFDVDIRGGEDQNGTVAGAQSRWERTLFHAQCRSCCAKVVNTMGLCPNWARFFCEEASLLQQIVNLAVQTDCSPQFMTLDEAEVRSVVIRRRLFQVMGNADYDSLERPEAGALSTHDLSIEGALGAVNLLSAANGGVHSLDPNILDQDNPSDQIDQLVVMGFPEEWCLIALQENDNDVASASTWIVDNLDTLTSMNVAPIDGLPAGFDSTSDEQNKTTMLPTDTAGASSRDPKETNRGEIDSQQESGSEASSVCDGHDAQPTDIGAQQQESSFLTNIDVLLHDTDRFDEEQAAIVYTENYFPSDPGSLPGPSFHGASSYGYGCGVGYGYGDSGLLAYRPKAITSEVAGMDASQLFEAGVRAESSLAILHARSTIVRIFQAWSGSASTNPVTLISSNLLVQLLKVMALRGCQIPVAAKESFTKSVIRPEEELVRCAVAIGASPLNATTVLRPVIAKMVVDEMAQKDGDGLPITLLNGALDDLEAAAFIDVFADTPWLNRNLCVSDSQAMLQPNVELAWWILDLLLSMRCPAVLHGHAFFRLSNCLRSANMPIKEIAMRAMSRIVVNWCELLELRAANVDVIVSGLADEMPTTTIIQELLHKSVPHAKLQCAAARRIASEQREERLVFSRYIHAMVELLVSIDKLESLMGYPLDSDIRQAEASASLLPNAGFEAPRAPQLVMATGNSVSIEWAAATNDGVNALEPSSLVRYELEMSSQLPAEGAMSSFHHVFTGMSTHYNVENLFPSRSYRFRVRALAPGKAPSAWSPESSFDTLRGAAFCFDRSNSGPAIFVSGDGMQATYGSNESWKTIVGTEPFSCGRNHWEIKIESSSTAYLFIGVATRRADLTTFLGGDDFGWGYIGDRALYHKRTKVKAYGERFGQGDVIGVTLDMDRGALSFSKNGLDLGVAFDGLAGEIYPAVAFYNQGQQISLLPYSFMCPGAGVVIKDSPASVGVSDAIELAQIMGSMKARQPMANSYMSKVHSSYTSWSNNTTVRYTTRAEYQLQFDTSSEKCGAFGLQAWERVRTPRGNATVVGVANEQLWLHVDGEYGAWFFASKEIKDGRTLGYFVSTGTRAAPLLSVSPSSTAEETKDETSVQESKEDDTGILMKSARSSRATGPLSFEHFKDVADSPRWTVASDALIVRALNVHSDKHEVSPWNASPEQALLVLHDSEPQIRAAAGQTWAGAPVRSFRSALVGRIAFLRYFNHKLVTCLPFVGLDDGLQLSSRPNVQASLWGELYEMRGLAVNEHSSSCNEPCAAYSRAAGFGLAPLLCALRSTVFIGTKQRAIELAVKRTVTHAKKAEDDYDYPEDLPQVLLNRPKAAAAQSRRNPETRLSMSIFGQLFDELHFMEPALLRMGYTHPMDDGQERTFKVKFDGEGVDDYGGPYREIFSQVAAEVQSCSSSAQLGAPTEQRCTSGCVLPLLCPSPNMKSDAAERSDTLLVQPRLTRHLYLEMYNFLGQVIGMALRSKVAIKVNLSSVFWKAMVGQPVDQDDLVAFDDATAAMVKHFRNLLRTGSAEELDASLTGVTWTTRLSNGERVDLASEGAQQTVSREDCQLFLDALCHARLHESDTALFAIRDGLASIVPAAILPLLTWEEVERQVCGKYEIDVKLLQMNTEYDDDVSPEDEHVVMFWRVLESFNHDERAAFLRFVWARSRLPPSANDFHQKFKIQAAVGDGPKTSPDTYLPKAHTCFFSLNLPRYSSEPLMADRLRYAMYNCIEMDADFRLAESEMGSAWVDIEADADA